MCCSQVFHRENSISNIQSKYTGCGVVFPGTFLLVLMIVD